MSFKNWSWWNKLIAILGGLAAITALIDFLNKKISILTPIYQWIVEKLTYPIPFYSTLLSVISTVFILWIIAKFKEYSEPKEREGILALNDECEARYTYFIDGNRVTLNHFNNPEGFTLFCSTHNLRLNRFNLTHEWLCPECPHQKRVGNHDDIISLIERKIRQEQIK